MTLENRSTREYPRYAHEAEITFCASADAGVPGANTRTLRGQSRNLSRGGLCATVSESIPVGLAIDIAVQLIFDDRRSEPLRLPARIAWCTPIDDEYQVGVQFLALDDETASYLTMFLRYLDRRSTGSAAAEPAPIEPRSIDDRFG